MLLAVIGFTAGGYAVQPWAIRQAQEDFGIFDDTTHHHAAAKQADAILYSFAHGIGAINECGFFKAGDDDGLAFGQQANWWHDKDGDLGVDGDGQDDYNREADFYAFFHCWAE